MTEVLTANTVATNQKPKSSCKQGQSDWQQHGSHSRLQALKATQGEVWNMPLDNSPDKMEIVFTSDRDSFCNAGNVHIQSRYTIWFRRVCI